MNQQIYRDDYPYAQGHDQSYTDEAPAASLRDYIEIVLRRKWIILCVFILTVAGTAAYTFTRTPLFESSATIEISDQSIKGSKESGLSASEGYKDSLQNEMAILKSRGLAEEYVSRVDADPEALASRSTELLAKIKLNGSAGPVRPKDRDIYEILSSEELDLTPVQRSMVGKVSSMVTVTPVKGSANFINVAVRAESPELARSVLKNFVRLYLEKNLEHRRSESTQAANWLNQELKKSEEKLRESQSNLFIFALENGIVEDDDKGKGFSFKILSRNFEGLQQSKQAQTKMQALKMHEGKMLPQGVNHEYLGKMKQDVAMMESEYAQMQGIYSENYPKMTLLRQKIKFLKEKIQSMEKQVVESSLEVAQTEQNLLEQSFQEAKGETDRIKSLEAHFTLLRKDVETNTEFHKILLKEYKQVDIRARTITNNARIIDPPTLPNSPAWPQKKLFLLIGALAGLIGGVGISILIDKLDSTIHSPMSLERQFGVRKLGLVPDVSRTITLPSKSGEDSNLALAAYHQPRTPLSDSIKNIHTSIHFSHLENPAKKIMLTSAAPGEGKTTISVSMATVLTSKGERRVVIADCDLRKPRVHKVLGRNDNSMGLSSYIHDHSVAFNDIIFPHKIDGLHYIPAGPIIGDPVDMLASDRMKGLVDKLSEEFDYVVLDAPPTLGFPDCIILSSYTDGVVFVVKHASSSRHEVEEALAALRSTNGTRILGVVMNMFNAPSAYGYKYRYGGYYYRNQKYYSQKESRA